MNKNSSNEELLQDPKVAEALKEGKIIIVDIQDTENPDYKGFFLAQQIEGIGTGSVNAAQALMLNFTTASIQRAYQNVAADNAKNVKPGEILNDLFDTDFSLEVRDSYEPDPNFDHQPRKGRNREKELEDLVCRDTGKPVYRNCILVPAGQETHKVVRTVLKSQYQPDKPIKKEKLEMTT